MMRRSGQASITSVTGNQSMWTTQRRVWTERATETWPGSCSSISVHWTFESLRMFIPFLSPSPSLSVYIYIYIYMYYNNPENHNDLSRSSLSLSLYMYIYNNKHFFLSSPSIGMAQAPDSSIVRPVPFHALYSPIPP